MLRFNIFKAKTSVFNDFEDFKKDISWFIRQDDNVSVESGKIELPGSFVAIFPTLSQLINASRILDIKINSVPFRLFSWTAKNGRTCGWLCKQEPADVSTLPIVPQHKLLLDTIGGIQESYNQPDNVLTNNQNFLFIKSECFEGLGSSDIYYRDVCEAENIEPLNCEGLIAFVGEANGGLTLYNITSGQVYLFSHDHCFENVTFMDGQPQYTFHYINNVNSFTDYVEEVAMQWLLYIKSTH